MLARFIHRTLSPVISPMVYIMVFVSIVIGFCFTFGLLVAGNESILYTTGVLVHKNFWGMALLVGATIAEIGLVSEKDSVATFGGMVCFMAWLFGCIALALAGHWYVFITVALFHLLFYGYVVLATSLGYIRRQPVS